EDAGRLGRAVERRDLAHPLLRALVESDRRLRLPVGERRESARVGRHLEDPISERRERAHDAVELVDERELRGRGAARDVEWHGSILRMRTAPAARPRATRGAPAALA